MVTDISWDLGQPFPDPLWTFMMEEKEGGWWALQESGDVGGGLSAIIICVVQLM